MAIVATDWTITRSTGAIRYTGDDHDGTAPSYATVLQMRRWLQDLADDQEYVPASSDEVDITAEDPARRFTDNYIRLKGTYNIDATAAEHLYDGSVLQGTGGTEAIYDGIVNYGNQGVVAQLHQNGAVITDDFWNWGIGGTHTGAGQAATLTDSSKSWTTDQFVGYVIKNTTDGSRGLITANTATTVTAVLYGGTEDDWDASDAYLISAGLNSDATLGISHRFLVNVRTAGADIDGRHLIGVTRTFGKTFSEFNIAATSRGNNTLAVNDATDINNTTAWSTVAGWTTITNVTQGYAAIDVDNDGTPENYWSEWNRDTFSINQLMERLKHFTSDGQSATFYGLAAVLFRGITHEIDVDGQGLTDFIPPEAISWTGGSGHLIAIDDVNAASKMWFQHLTGSLPGDNDAITGTSTATANAELTGGSLVERVISTPFFGQSTGTAIIGAYGFGVEKADLSATDKVTDLTATQRTPPNNVTNTVAGLVSTEDYVFIAPWDGTTTDSEGKPVIQTTNMSNTGLLSGAAVASIEVDEAIPTWVPDSGTLRVVTNLGRHQHCVYTSVNRTTRVFTISPTEDFSSDNASIGNDIYVTPIDKLSAAATEQWAAIHTTDDDFVLVVRDGGGTPIEEYKVGITWEANNQTFNVIRQSDE